MLLTPTTLGLGHDDDNVVKRSQETLGFCKETHSPKVCHLKLFGKEQFLAIKAKNWNENGWKLRYWQFFRLWKLLKKRENMVG